MFRLLADGLLDLIYPPFCILCENALAPRYPKDVVCPRCEDALEFNHPPFCVRCSRVLTEKEKHPQCKSCREIKPAFDFAWSACLYNDEMQKLIHEFKYNQKTFLAHYFKERIIQFIQTHSFDINQFDLILPVPLSATRLRERGYNQSELLARALSDHFQIPINTNNLIKTKNTHPQTQLSQKERWTNIIGAFKMSPNLKIVGRNPVSVLRKLTLKTDTRMKNLNTIKNKNVLIVDDLLTTGATTSEAARVLKLAGAKTVGVLTLAVTP